MDLMSTTQLLGNLGEFVGAIAVVATLVYLTKQVRQNTRSINSNNSNSVMTGFNQLNVALGSDAEATQILYQGFHGIEQLSEVDKHRFTHLMNGFFNIFRNLYHQYLDGTFPETQWQVWALEARQLMETPGVEYFRKRTKSYEDLFQYLEGMPDDSQQPLSLNP